MHSLDIVQMSFDPTYTALLTDSVALLAKVSSNMSTSTVAHNARPTRR
jgi:hypothetical protein